MNQPNPTATWTALQALEQDAYRQAYARQGNYRGFFSVPEYRDAVRAGRRIAEACSACLDIGSGVMERPSYMQPTVAFQGLDPFFGEHRRAFPFVQAVGEHLPYRDGSFPCASLMSSLDHQYDPQATLREAYRILRPQGRLYIWTLLYAEADWHYQHWAAQPPGTLFDDHHQHAFTLTALTTLLSASGFAYQGCEHYHGTDYWPPSWLLVAIKEPTT